MAFKEKILWVVHYDNLNDFLDMARSAGATGVAIRTDNNLEKAIPKFHSSGIKVFGWRWPSAKSDPAMKQAKIAAALIADYGMDGYFVDPEGDPGKPWDWDQLGLTKLAQDFCATVKAASKNARFGVTSHFKGVNQHHNLPWSAFINAAHVLLPQAYWQVDGGKVFKGDPAQNYLLSIKHWTKTGGAPDMIVPMAGEIAHSTAQQIKEYAAAAAKEGRDEVHFYTATPAVSKSVWNAIEKI